MNDKQMLELAARAAGIECLGKLGWRLPCGQTQSWWNPLTDDGDLYRLARAVGIDISFSDKSAYKRLPDGSLIQTFWGEILDHPNDKVDDEAHAITRAAAEIGRAI